jgi:hypothetical protein
MRAAEYFADKSELSSHLTPNSIYLLSAPSTPEVVKQKVIDAVKSGEPPKPAEVSHMVWEAKEQARLEKEQERLEKKRQKMTKEERKKDEERERRSKARRQREDRERTEEIQKKLTAAKAAAREFADILIEKLSNDEIDRICEVLDDWRVTREVLAIFGARAEAHQSHDNVTALSLKPHDAR